LTVEPLAPVSAAPKRSVTTRRGFSARALLVAIILVALIPPLGIGGWLTKQTIDAEREQLERSVQQRAREISNILDREILGAIGIISALATSEMLRREDFKGFYDWARGISQDQGFGILLYRPDRAEQLINTVFPFVTPVPWGFAAPKEFRDRAVAAGGPTVFDLVYGPAAKTMAVAVAVPVRIDGDTKFILVAAIPADRVAEIFKLVQLPPDMIATIVDRNLAIIARSSKHEEFVGKVVPERRGSPASGAGGIVEADNMEGVPTRRYFQQSAVTGWTVSVGAPASEFQTPYWLSPAGFTLLTGTLVALALALAYGIGGHISRTVAKLKEIARELPNGDAAAVGASHLREANDMIGALRVASESLQSNDAQQRFALEAAGIGTWSWDVINNVYSWSPRGFEIFGFSETYQPSVENFFAAIHPADRARIRSNLQSCFLDLDRYDNEYRIIPHGTDKVCWVAGRGRVERDASGSVVFIHGTFQEITGRKEAERERDDLRRKLMDAQENERLRLAHELHDQTGQILTASLLELKQLGSKVGKDDDKSIQRLREQLEEIGRTVHRIAHELRPTAIEDLGLQAALANHISDWSAQYSIPVDFHCNKDGLDRLSGEIQTAVYRIVQEALTNVARHASGVTAVSVILDRMETALNLTIEDDGCGFDVERPRTGANGGGLGLAGMRERAGLIGGTFEIESSEGTGTTLFVRIPTCQDRKIA
jgi:signal transduction histidine kinase